jgi:putative lipoic acid-binding regulatory protein
MTTPPQASLLEFPCAFPLKIMGAMHVDFAQTILVVVQAHAPDFDATTMEMRPSRQGNYLSLTCTINATSQVQLDALYLALTQHPMVKMVF